MIILEIPRATPSRNATFHKHWLASYREKKLWAWEVRLALSGRRPMAFTGRARVTIERRSRRLLDPDNLVGGFKSLLDALKAERIIADDSAAHIDLVPKQTKGEPRTVVTVEAA